MATDRDAVEQFFREVDAAIRPVLEEKLTRFKRLGTLLREYDEQRAAWRVSSGAEVDSFGEKVNELCVARWLIETYPANNLEYAAPLHGIGGNIDFLIEPYGPGERPVYLEVKTIHAQDQDAWSKFEEAKQKGYFPEDFELVLDKDYEGGSIYHDFFSSRAKFLERTREVEEKSAHLRGRDGCVVRLVCFGFTGEWWPDQFEDFWHCYATGHHRTDDGFRKMEAFYMAHKPVVLARTIQGFYVFQRGMRSIPVKVTEFLGSPICSPLFCPSPPRGRGAA